MFINKLLSIHSFIKRICLFISGTALIFMMFFITADVLLRNIQGTSIPGSYEYVQNYLMPLIVFPGLTFVYTSGVLPRVLNLVEKFSTKVQYFLNISLRGIDFIIFSLMFYFSLKYAIIGSFEGVSFTAGGSLIPLYPALFVAPFGLFVLLVEVSIEMSKDIRSRRGFAKQVEV